MAAQAPSDTRPPENAAAPVPTAAADTQPSLRLCLAGALTVFVFGVAALTGWLYAFPSGYAGAMAGLNPRAVVQFQEHLPFRGLVPLTAAAWSQGFRLILLALWAAYALAVLATLHGAAPRPRTVSGTMAAAALCLAVLCPPLLTTDCYSYLGYSHLHVLYGLNPYVTTTGPLFAHRDPVTRFLFWRIPTVYGPLWTALTDVIVRTLPHSLWGQIVAVKLIGAAALGAAALAGRRIADHFQPGRGDLTFLAIGLNPLLLIEGCGSGHNDLLMIALALGGVALLLEKRWAWAGLLLGLSVGVKLITLALLPWLLLECRRGGGRTRPAAPLTLAAAALFPLLLGYAAFWHGPQTLLALQQRSLSDLDPAVRTQTAQSEAWLAAHRVAPGAIPLLSALYQRRLLVGVYAALSAWLWRTRMTGGWLTAWIVFAPVLMFTGMGNSLPWYVAWFWPVALLRWNRFSLAASAAAFLLALLWESFYASLVRL